MVPDLLLLTFYMCLIGAAIGTVSGLVPGIHVNTLALILLTFRDDLTALMGGFAPEEYAPALLSVCVLSAAVVHSAVDFVPSVFLGVPDPDTVLNVLPGHRLLLEGKGMTAVRCAAIGSLVGSAASIALAVPMYMLLSGGLGDYLDSITVGFLVLSLALMLISERHSRPAAVAMMALSGILGLVCMTDVLPMESMTGMPPEVMFPMLTGLFGIPAMLLAPPNGTVPPQTDVDRRPVGAVPGLKGVLTGSVTGWFPGITSTTGAVFAGAIFGQEDRKGFISMVSSIGTASTMFAFVTFCVSGKERSGTMSVIGGLLDGASVAPGTDVFLMMMLTMVTASVLAYAVMIASGRAMCRLCEHTDTARVNAVIILMTVVLTVVFTGYWGLVLLAASTAVGMLPLVTGADRMHLTGCLIVPVLLFRLGLA